MLEKRDAEASAKVAAIIAAKAAGCAQAIETVLSKIRRVAVPSWGRRLAQWCRQKMNRR